MGFIIKDLQELTLAMFEGFGTDKEEETAQRLEAAERENDLIFWHYMKLLKKGVYDVIQTTDSITTYTYTRSAQAADTIQRTVFIKDSQGDLLPLSHSDITTEKNNIPLYDLYTAGQYKTITY
jgi:DNA polymerase/3'-5' exonuclease PolX